MDKLKRVTFEQLVNGEANQVSLLNEPVVDYFVDFAVKEPALEIAQRRWFKSRKDHEREQ